MSFILNNYGPGDEAKLVRISVGWQFLKLKSALIYFGKSECFLHLINTVERIGNLDANIAVEWISWELENMKDSSE